MGTSLLGCRTRSAWRAGARAHLARGCSGQSRRLIDGRGQGGRSTGKFREQQSNRLRNSEDKGRAGQRGGMIVRGAAVIMLRSALVMVGRSVAMGNALRMRRDFPVLIGMNPLSHGQQR